MLLSRCALSCIVLEHWLFIRLEFFILRESMLSCISLELILPIPRVVLEVELLNVIDVTIIRVSI